MALFGKKTKIAEIESEMVQIQKEFDTLVANINESRIYYSGLETETLSTSVKAVEREMTQIEMQIAQVEFEKKHALEGISRHQQEQDALLTEIQTLKDLDKNAVEQLQILEQKKSEIEIAVTESQRELETLERQFREKAGRASQLGISVLTLQTELGSAQKDSERVVKTLEENTKTFARREDEITRAKDEITQLTEKIETQTLEIGKLQNELEAQDLERKEIERVYS